LIYVDTSALLTLVILEPESEAFDQRVVDTGMTASALLLVEARRAITRLAPERLPRLDLVLARVEIIDLSGPVLETAGRLPDPLLRSLDAIHLATALLVREDLEAFLTYDDRLAAAATAHGLSVETPGRG
jgi:uncharacterized protein